MPTRSAKAPASTAATKPASTPAIDVAALKVVSYPAAVLREKAKPIEKITDAVKRVAARMIELMREEEGIGLAAPQVGLPWRMFVVHVPESDERTANTEPSEHPTANTGPEVYINPKIINPIGAPEAMEEGCLSLPDIRGEVLRPPVVTITATGLDGKPFTRTGAGLLARCWQHEMDHLDGILIIDKMTQMSRIKNRMKVKELEKN